MPQASSRTTLRGPAFIRMLARLTGVDVSSSPMALSDRLTQWLDWNHALALSTALDRGEAADTGDVPATEYELEVECARLRTGQIEAITADTQAGAGDRSRPGKVAADDAGANEAIDYAVFRQRYLARQRAMQSVTGNLRGRLRDRLAAQSSDMARLAEVDAAMEMALSPREQALLAHVPVVLESHFQSLHQHANADTSTTNSIWLDVFRKDMQSVLLAELDVRFQPVDALLAALRTC